MLYPLIVSAKVCRSRPDSEMLLFLPLRTHKQPHQPLEITLPTRLPGPSRVTSQIKFSRIPVILQPSLWIITVTGRSTAKVSASAHKPPPAAYHFKPPRYCSMWGWGLGRERLVLLGSLTAKLQSTNYVCGSSQHECGNSATSLIWSLHPVIRLRKLYV